MEYERAGFDGGFEVWRPVDERYAGAFSIHLEPGLSESVKKAWLKAKIEDQCELMATPDIQKILNRKQEYEFREYFVEPWGDDAQFDIRETRRHLPPIRVRSRARAVRLISILANRGGWGKTASLAAGHCAFRIVKVTGFCISFDGAPLILLDKAGNVVDEDFKG